MFIFILLLTCLHNVTPKTLPSFIHRCSKSDPNLNKCLDNSTVEAARHLKNGYKPLGVVPLEPFVISQVDLGNRTAGAVYLHQIYNNMKLFGMTEATISDSQANLSGENCYWNYKCRVPFVRMESEYIMKGQLLLFKINGHGNCTNYLYGVDGHYGVQCERYTKKNRTYLRVKKFSFQMKPDKIVFDFDNLIDGNKQLSEEVVKTLNENSESVYADVAEAFNEVMATVWKETINQVFSRVPEDELFLP